MKILQFISSLGGGGAEKQFGYLCESLVELGHDVVAVSFRTGSNLDYVLESGATYIQVHNLGNFDPIVIWKLCRLVSIHKPDILQSWIPQMDIIVGIVAALSNVSGETLCALGQTGDDYPGMNRLQVWDSIHDATSHTYNLKIMRLESCVKVKRSRANGFGSR